MKRACRILRLPLDLVVAGVALFLLAPVWLLPRRAGLAVARAYGLMAAVIDPHARRVARINVRRAYGAISEKEARRIAWQVFANMAQSLAEGLCLVRALRRGEGLAIAFDIEDPALDERIRADPRPKIFVTGHLGSWEVMSIVAGVRHGTPRAVIARSVDNPFVDRMFRRLRLPDTVALIEKRGAASQAIALLRAGTSVAMLVDENGGRRGVFVDFFGRPASTSRLPAILSFATGAPIVLAAAVRGDTRDRFTFRLALFEPRDYRQEGNESRSVRDLTQAIMRRYEAWVRDAPVQWRWIHWRWKTRPDGSEETYSRRDLATCVAGRERLTI